MMKRVRGYEGMRQAAEAAGTRSRSIARLGIGPDPVAVVINELALISTHAAATGLVTSVLDDPENTPEAYRVLVLLNGTTAQMKAFSAAMVDARADRAD